MIDDILEALVKIAFVAALFFGCLFGIIWVLKHMWMAA
jgi:hypothetical protein